MLGYFLDTSAVAKLYHREIGSQYLDGIVKQPNSRLFVSRLTIVEMESVFAIKVRTGEIGQKELDLARRCLRADLIQQRLWVGPPIQSHHYHAARTMLMEYGVSEGLRTLDALQLAMALDLRRVGLISIVVASDVRLCRVALLAGCSAVNPEKPDLAIF